LEEIEGKSEAYLLKRSGDTKNDLFISVIELISPFCNKECWAED